jgi:starch synthase
VCKTSLQEELGLEVDSEAALVVFVSRITEQKMADVVAVALPRIVESGAQRALVGDGDRLLEERFEVAARHHPSRIAFRMGYEEPLAHRVLASGDILLHPARFEPCGLTQLYAMRYGTLPVVRNTGGLCDTVVDAAEHSIRQGTATGFAFAQDFGWSESARRYFALYRDLTPQSASISDAADPVLEKALG